MIEYRGEWEIYSEGCVRDGNYRRRGKEALENYRQDVGNIGLDEKILRGRDCNKGIQYLYCPPLRDLKKIKEMEAQKQ